MRNIMEYPITKEEIVERLEELAEEKHKINEEQHACGDITSLLLLFAAEIIKNSNWVMPEIRRKQ